MPETGAALSTKPWICEHPLWLKVWEKHISVSLEYPEPACLKRSCKGALEPKGCCCKGPKHRTAVLSGSGLVFGSVLPEDLQLSSPLGAGLPTQQNWLAFRKRNRPSLLELGVLGCCTRGEGCHQTTFSSPASTCAATAAALELGCSPNAACYKTFLFLNSPGGETIPDLSMAVFLLGVQHYRSLWDAAGGAVVL